MPQIVPLTFAPDLDSAWGANPGALVYANGLAPLQNGALGSVGEANYFTSSTLTGTDILAAHLFRQINGSVRLLTFRAGDIDEYTSGAARTNRATGLTAASEWNAAAWGNQIIAVSKANAPQSSTGAGFSALSGSPPKARHIAVNVDFTMLADVDDSGSNVYEDMVWWSGIGNPLTWTPSLATQAGNLRLTFAPGPITALVPFRDGFVVFKDNAVIMGKYIGGEYTFAWQPVSVKVGCIASKAVAELDGRLYFLHTSGVYEFDGQSLRNVGLPVMQSFLRAHSYISGTGGAGNNDLIAGYTGDALSLVDAVADDIEGVVWFRSGVQVITSGARTALFYGYNQRSGKWGTTFGNTTGTTFPSPPRLVKGNTSDIQTFLANTGGRVLYILNSAGGTTCRILSYPAAMTGWSVITGVFGSFDNSSLLTRVWPRLLRGSSQQAISAATVNGYTSEDLNITNGSQAMSLNADYDCLDGRLSAKFKTLTLTGGTNKTTILAGLGIEETGGGKR